MKTRAPLLLVVSLALCGCGTTDTPSPAATKRAATAAAEPTPATFVSFSVTKQSLDQAYGYGPDKPVKVGGADTATGPLRERMFLEQLAGPKGQALRFQHKGTSGLLNLYEVWIGTEPTPRTLYLSTHEFEEPLAPVGFLAKPY